MRITKKKGQNDYTISGLTLGKIDAIRCGLSRLKEIGETIGTTTIYPLEDELLRELEFIFQYEEILKPENVFKY